MCMCVYIYIYMYVYVYIYIYIYIYAYAQQGEGRGLLRHDVDRRRGVPRRGHAGDEAHRGPRGPQLCDARGDARGTDKYF